MMTIINDLINVICGSYGTEYIIPFDSLFDRLEFILAAFGSNQVPITWFIDGQLIASLVFYGLMIWCIFYMFLIIPFRLIKSLLPKALKKRS